MIINFGYGANSRSETYIATGMIQDPGVGGVTVPGVSGRRISSRFVVAIGLIMTILGGKRWE